MGALASGSASASTDTHPITQTENADRALANPFDGSSLSGNYLAGRFAQRRHDWDAASMFMNRVLKETPDNTLLIKRAMVLAMGSGHVNEAVSLAKEINAHEKDSALALLFIAMDDFRNKDYKQAAQTVDAMPKGGLSDFIMPLLHSWSKAAIGIHDTKDLNDDTIHIYHAILIADFLGEHSHIENLLKKALNAEDVSMDDMERIADIYGHIGEKDTALGLYRKILEAIPDNTPVQKKIETLEHNGNVRLFETVKSPENGMAEALYDMARILYRDYSDESARIFSYMALALNPSLVESRLLLAHIAARNDRYDEAISHYRAVPDNSDYFPEARRLTAELLEDNNQIESALAELEQLVQDHQDLEALIQIGDIYRHNKDFRKAIATYDRALKQLGKTIPDNYWYLYYVRGMSYEQLGKWPEAEADLKTALTYQPDHPFVLNYLGYAWADQGTHLKESLDMIRKAAALQPSDGYIADSLGWVLYRMGEHKKSIPHLERAVELMPYDAVINDHLGDAYWRVGRKLEARFQWLRAKNHMNKDDTVSLKAIDQKLVEGLNTLPILKAAHSETDKRESKNP